MFCRTKTGAAWNVRQSGADAVIVGWSSDVDTVECQNCDIGSQCRTSVFMTMLAPFDSITSDGSDG